MVFFRVYLQGKSDVFRQLRIGASEPCCRRNEVWTYTARNGSDSPCYLYTMPIRAAF